MHAFISHSSADNAIAAELERRLRDRELDARTDLSDMRAGELVDAALFAKIRGADMLLLVWSKDAAASSWVAAEWLVAFHEGKLVVPCVRDDTELPQCLRKAAYIDLRWDWERIVDELLRTAEEAPRLCTNIVVPTRGSQSPEAWDAIMKVYSAQEELLAALDEPDIARARDIQASLEPKVADLVQRWPHDTEAVMYAGYHHKNAYQLTHWEEIQAGVRPADPALEQAERCFFQALSIDPEDHGALNGLGNYRWFLLDLEAARFFTQKAIEHAERLGDDASYYREDLKGIERDLAAQAARS